MQLGTRIRYGMVAVLDIARRRQISPVRAADIASATGISRGYLEGLLAALRRAGLVRAIRGPGGGWKLSRPAAKMRPTDIFSVLEGPTALVQCAEDAATCGVARQCGARRLWVRLGKALNAALRQESIAQLAGIVKKRKPAKRSKRARTKARTRVKARARVLRRGRVKLVKKKRPPKKILRARAGRLRKSA